MFKTPAARFCSESLAWSFCDRCTKTHMVILGEAEQYWVVTMAEAERLMKAGYEAARRALTGAVAKLTCLAFFR